MSEQAASKHTAFPWWQGKDEDGGLVYGVEHDTDTGAEHAVVVADTSREDGDAEKESANAAAIVAHAKQAQTPTVPREVADRLAEAIAKVEVADWWYATPETLNKILREALADYRKAVSRGE